MKTETGFVGVVFCGLEFDGCDTFGGIGTVGFFGTLNICGSVYFSFFFFFIYSCKIINKIMYTKIVWLINQFNLNKIIFPLHHALLS